MDHSDSERCRHVEGTAGYLQQAAGVAHDDKDVGCKAAGAPQPARVVLVQGTGGDVRRSVRGWDFVQRWPGGLDHLQAACKSIDYKPNMVCRVHPCVASRTMPSKVWRTNTI